MLRRRTSRVVVMVLATILAVAAVGCGEEPTFDPDVLSAYESFTAAVKAGDGGRLWELSPPSLHESVAKLRLEMLSTAALVRKEYPKSDQDLALQNLAAELYEGTETAREMFVRMLHKEAMKSDDATDRGLEPVAVKVNGDEATVETRGGETFRFVKAEGEWRCTTLVAQFEAWPPLGRLRKNAEVARNNIESWRRNKRETTDRSKPAGAFNIVLEAVRRGARVTVYEQLDKGSVDTLKNAYQVFKTLQTTLEARFPSKAERTKYLTDRKALWVERVANEKTLFALLWDQGKFTAALPPKDGTAVVTRAETPKDDLAVVFVKTDAGERKFEFHRVLGGSWRFADLRAVIEREALRFAEAEVRSLPAK